MKPKIVHLSLGQSCAVVAEHDERLPGLRLWRDGKIARLSSSHSCRQTCSADVKHDERLPGLRGSEAWNRAPRPQRHCAAAAEHDEELPGLRQRSTSRKITQPLSLSVKTSSLSLVTMMRDFRAWGFGGTAKSRASQSLTQASRTSHSGNIAQLLLNMMRDFRD